LKELNKTSCTEYKKLGINSKKKLSEYCDKMFPKKYGNRGSKFTGYEISLKKALATDNTFAWEFLSQSEVIEEDYSGDE